MHWRSPQQEAEAEEQAARAAEPLAVPSPKGRGSAAECARGQEGSWMPGAEQVPAVPWAFARAVPLPGRQGVQEELLVPRCRELWFAWSPRMACWVASI